LRKHYYIFLFIVIGAILSGNLALGGYFQDNGRLRVKTLTKPAQFGKIALISSYEPFLGDNPTESDLAHITAKKSLEDILLPEKELAIRQEAVCDFLESERPEKYLKTNICQ
jgi:hypothetical protein